MSFWFISVAVPNSLLEFGTATMVGLWSSLEKASLKEGEDQSDQWFESGFFAAQVEMLRTMQNLKDSTILFCSYFKKFTLKDKHSELILCK